MAFYVYSYFFPKEKQPPVGVSSSLRESLDDNYNEKTKETSAIEESKYGRILTPQERIALRRSAEGNLSVNDIGDMNLVLKEKHIERQELRKNAENCDLCCTFWSVLRVTPPIAVMAFTLAWFDVSAERVKDMRAARKYMAAIFVPFLATTAFGGYFFSKSLNSLKPTKENNFRRSMCYYALGATACTAAPIGAYHVLRHHLLRPKNINKVKYFVELNQPPVPFKPSQYFGLYKPWDKMCAKEFCILSLFYSLAVPLGLYLSAMRTHAGDAILLQENREFIYACVPIALQVHVRNVIERKEREKNRKRKEEKKRLLERQPSLD